MQEQTPYEEEQLVRLLQYMLDDKFHLHGPAFCFISAEMIIILYNEIRCTPGNDLYEALRAFFCRKAFSTTRRLKVAYFFFVQTTALKYVFWRPCACGETSDVCKGNSCLYSSVHITHKWFDPPLTPLPPLLLL